MADEWVNVGAVDDLRRVPLQQLVAGRTRLAVSWVNGEFGVVSGVCNHAGGPLGNGTLDGEYITCPWHAWKFHCRTGVGEPGSENDIVPRYDCEVRDGALWVNLSMIITGGQDNVQAVAGQILGFFAEIGCTFPPFPYVAHSRGWTAEDMEANVNQVATSKDLHDGVRALVDRALHTAARLLATADLDPLTRGGRKAHRLE